MRQHLHATAKFSSAAVTGSQPSHPSISSAIRITWKSWRLSSAEGPPSVSAKINAPAPALLPHPLANGAGNTRRLRRYRNRPWLGLRSGNLEHKLGARRFDEFLAFA